MAIFDASDDTVEMLSHLLQHAGLRTVDGHASDISDGEFDLSAFVKAHTPNAIIWDVSPPYAQNWKFLQLMQAADSIRSRGIVVTTTRLRYLKTMPGFQTGDFEILEKPYDLDLVLSAIRRVLALP